MLSTKVTILDPGPFLGVNLYSRLVYLSDTFNFHTTSKLLLKDVSPIVGFILLSLRGPNIEYPSESL